MTELATVRGNSANSAAAGAGDLSANSDSTKREAEPYEYELTILMPCLNEAETLAACITKARSAIDELKLNAEIVVADNGSTDGSQAIAEQGGARVVSERRRGYGSALLAGVAAAKGRYIIFADADGSYDLRSLAPFLTKLREGYDLVMGNRFKGEIATGAMPLLHRYLGTPVLTTLSRIFFRTPCGDVNCGMRGIRKVAAERLALRSTGMEFASEMLVKACLFRMKIGEVPTSLSPDGRSRSPHLRTWRDGWRHLRFLLMYTPRWALLYPGLVLILAGLTGCALLLPGPRVVHGIGFDVHTLLYAFISVLLGFQLVSFAMFTKVFAVAEGLLPEDPRLNRAFRWITLEKGLFVGGVLVLAGLGGSVWAVSHWARVRFGALSSEQTLRVVMPAVFSLTLGAQVIFSSFFLSILGLRRR